MEIKLTTETMQILISGIKKSKAHLNVVIMALSEKKIEESPLFAEISQIRDSLDSLDSNLNPTIFFKNDPAVY